MYEELFKYGHWEKDEGIDTFYGISLNRDIGDYKAGKFFDYAIDVGISLIPTSIMGQGLANMALGHTMKKYNINKAIAEKIWKQELDDINLKLAERGFSK